MSDDDLNNSLTQLDWLGKLKGGSLAEEQKLPNDEAPKESPVEVEKTGEEAEGGLLDEQVTQAELMKQFKETMSVVDPSTPEKIIKPPHSYASLIRLAIMDSSSGKATLSEIYHWIRERFLYYKATGNGWKNSIRHNLSLNKAFRKLPREKDDPGKGCYWEIDKDHINRLDPQHFPAMKKKRATSTSLKIPHKGAQKPKLNQQLIVRHLVAGSSLDTVNITPSILAAIQFHLPRESNVAETQQSMSYVSARPIPEPSVMTLISNSGADGLSAGHIEDYTNQSQIVYGNESPLNLDQKSAYEDGYRPNGLTATASSENQGFGLEARFGADSQGPEISKRLRGGGSTESPLPTFSTSLDFNCINPTDVHINGYGDASSSKSSGDKCGGNIKDFADINLRLLSPTIYGDKGSLEKDAGLLSAQTSVRRDHLLMNYHDNDMEDRMDLAHTSSLGGPEDEEIEDSFNWDKIA